MSEALALAEQQLLAPGGLDQGDLVKEGIAGVHLLLEANPDVLHFSLLGLVHVPSPAGWEVRGVLRA